MIGFYELPDRHRSDVQPLDAVEVFEGEREALAFVGGEELIDVYRVNRLIALVVATTVAERVPASR